MRPKQIKELLKIVENSDIDELEVTKWWGTRVRIKKSLTIDTPAPSQTITPQAPAFSEPAKISSLEQIKEEPKEEVVKAAAPTDNLLEIKSPMVGTFYRAPAPEASTYVEVGDTISPGKVLCIIEAMKLMNEIEAEISGKIIEILIENAQPVEYNQVLFKVQK